MTTIYRGVLIKHDPDTGRATVTRTEFISSPPPPIVHWRQVELPKHDGTTQKMAVRLPYTQAMLERARNRTESAAIELEVAA